MNMITFTSFTFDNIKAFIFGNILNYFIQSILDFRYKNFLSIFYTPDDMIVDIIDTGPCMNILVFHTYSIA